MRRFVLPIVVLIVLLVAFILLIDPAGWFKNKAKENADADLPVLCDLKSDDISSIEFTKPEGDKVRLERDGDNWNLLGEDKTYRADSDKMKKMLDDLPGLTATGLVTDNPDKYETFEVDDGHATVLTVTGASGTTPVTLMVGKAAPGFTSAFVRQDEGKEVYSTNRNVRQLLAYAFDDYRTKQPWKFDQLSATEIKIRPVDSKEDYKDYKRDGGTWKTADGANANQNALTELANKLSELRASNFAGEMSNAADAEAAGMAGVDPQLIISTSQGTYSLTIGGSDEAMRFVADQEGHLYKIGSASLKFYTELDQSTLDIGPPEVEATSAAGQAAPPTAGVTPAPPSTGDKPPETK